VTHNPTRKKFFANLLGGIAAASVAPKIFAETSAGAQPAVDTAVKAPRRLEIRPEPRAVARRDVA
jgi:hypothetical protein